MRYDRNQGGLEQLADTTAQVADHLGIPVVAACPFSRRGMMANKVAGRFGLIAYFASKQVQKARAGGLPEKFMLAVTDADVIAVAYANRGFSQAVTLGDEVARWRRCDLAVSVKKGMTPYLLDVTLESPAEDEKVLCAVGDSSVSDAFLALLGAGSTVAAAA